MSPATIVSPATSAAIVVTVFSIAVFLVLSLRAGGIRFVMITLAIGQILWGVALPLGASYQTDRDC